MSVELLQTLSIVAYIVAAALFLVAVALFFLLNVPRLVGDISGANARKAIEAIRQQNEDTGNKAYKPSAVNAARGKLTDRISPSGGIVQQSSGLSVGAQTEKFATVELSAAVQGNAILNSSAETTVLGASTETTVLGISSETTVLNSDPFGLTAALTSQNGPPAEKQKAVISNVAVDVEMSFMGSSEIIE